MCEIVMSHGNFWPIYGERKQRENTVCVGGLKKYNDDWKWDISRGLNHDCVNFHCHAMPVRAAFNIRGVGGVLMGESSFLFICIRVGKSNYGFTPNYF